jgi:hypothetical protein
MKKAIEELRKVLIKLEEDLDTLNKESEYMKALPIAMSIDAVTYTISILEKAGNNSKG